MSLSRQRGLALFRKQHLISAVSFGVRRIGNKSGTGQRPQTLAAAWSSERVSRAGVRSIHLAASRGLQREVLRACQPVFYNRRRAASRSLEGSV